MSVSERTGSRSPRRCEATIITSALVRLSRVDRDADAGPGARSATSGEDGGGEQRSEAWEQAHAGHAGPAARPRIGGPPSRQLARRYVEHGEHAAVVVVAGGQVELAEDAGDVLLDRAAA